MSVCFSSLSQVTLASGESQNISDISPYEQLLTVSGTLKTPRVKSSPFYTYLHFDKDVSTEFLVLTCEDDLQLIISETHLLFRKSSQDAAVKATMAKNVEVGEYLLRVNAQKEIQVTRVVSIDRKEIQGVFAPLTKNGTLIVDGFLVSCYATVNSHTHAHTSLTPVRFWHQLRSKIGKGKVNSTPKTGIHGYAKVFSSIVFHRLE